MKFEYKILRFNPGNSATLRELNEAGEDGWECFVLIEDEFGKTAYLKRQKQ